jgi:hypothetical protein
VLVSISEKMDAAQQASTGSNHFTPPQPVPLALYFGLSLLRAVDLGMTNIILLWLPDLSRMAVIFRVL